jgi:PKHD-type hydroxylase
MKQYYIRKLLNTEDIKEIQNIIKYVDENNFWMDGETSLIGNTIDTKKIKNNLELSDLNSSQIINSKIMQSLDMDQEFLDYTVASKTFLNIISKTQEGGYYKPHNDNWSNGDYSTTVFLNDTSEYNGGELCLYFGGEDEIKIKLNAGWAITYRTGILHRVNKVKSGSRYISVFWTKSLIKDHFIRYIYSELSNIKNNIKNYNPIEIRDCLSSTKDPIFSIDNLKNEILRRYS